jgi:hypothetical protein
MFTLLLQNQPQTLAAGQNAWIGVNIFKGETEEEAL